MLDDLRTGAWAAATPKLRKALAATARLRHIPAPDGRDSWSEDDLDDLVQEFIADKDDPGRLVQLATSSTDDEHCGRLVDAAVRNFLVDRAREDPRPKLYRTLKTLCRTEPSLKVVGDRVTWSGADPSNGQTGDHETLLLAAKTITVGPPPYEPTAKREGPPTDRNSLIALCHTVLNAAGGSLALDALTAVVAERLEVRLAWDDRFDDALHSTRATVTDRSTPISADARALAMEIWDILEHELVTHIGTGGVTATGETDFPMGKSTAQERLDALKPKLAGALDGLEVVIVSSGRDAGRRRRSGGGSMQLRE